MARNLSGTIRDAFHGYTYNHCGVYYSQSAQLSNNTIRHLEIPLDKDIIEMPLFAFDSFTKALEDGNNNADAIVTILRTFDSVSSYKTLDRSMKDILSEKYKDSKLVKIDLSKDNQPLIYYGTCGAIFDKDFVPLAVCLWQMEKCHIDAYSPVKYKFLRPIIRVNPYVYLGKTNSMERFIAGKMINTCLETDISTPPYWRTSVFLQVVREYQVKVEIDQFNFVIHDVNSPSISTSNKQLLQLAIDHLDEIVQ